MKRALAAIVCVLTLGGGLVLAQGDPISTRRDIMKGVGAAARTGTQMVRGEQPFDLAKAQDVLRTYAAAAEGFHTHFPAGSETGGGTTAAPAVFTNQADFRARFDAWAADIKAASAQTKDLESFRAAFGNASRACGACHNTYRLKS